MKGHSGPCDALHVRHRRAVIQVRKVLPVLLQDGEDTGRGLVAARARGDPRLGHHAMAIEHLEPLLAQGNHDRQGIAAAGLAVDLGIVAAATAGFGGVGKQSGEGRAGRKRKREGCNNAPCRSGKSGDGALACLPGQSTR